MKKLTAKKDKKHSKQQPAARITNDTVEEHRKRVISDGKKFKYPLQYSRHKLVINTIIISVLVVISAVVAGWIALYPGQNTSEFMYRVTRVLPLPVASVDGQQVRYSDYLMKYKSTEYYLREKERANLSGDDGARQLEFIKQQSMEDAVADAYAAKLAKDRSITVTDVELEEFLQQQRTLADESVSQEAYEAVIRDYYNWSYDEYRDVMRAKLLRQKIEYEIDESATANALRVGELLADEEDLRQVVEDHAADMPGISFAASGWVQRNNQDGGLTAEAAKLQPGEVSSLVTPIGGGGYYYIHLVDQNENQVSYEYIRIPLRAFDQKLQDLYTSDNVRYYIDIPKPGDATKDETEE